MDDTTPRFSELFAQLGLDNDDLSIQRFLRQHRPLEDTIELHAADFWSPQQAAFLKEAIKTDDNWAVVVDQLNAALREPVDPHSLPSA